MQFQFIYQHAFVQFFLLRCMRESFYLDEKPENGLEKCFTCESSIKNGTL